MENKEQNDIDVLASVLSGEDEDYTDKPKKKGLFKKKNAEDVESIVEDSSDNNSKSDNNDSSEKKEDDITKKTEEDKELPKKKKDKRKKAVKKDDNQEESIDDYKIDEDGNFIKKKKRKSSKKRKPEEINIVKELLSLIIYFAIVALAVYFILTFVGCKSLVNGDSMNNTLYDGEQVWVDKLSYRFSSPKRFDVVIFNYDEDTTYVKRIIGLPGETVKIDPNGNIYINDKLMNEDYGLQRIQPDKIGRASVPIELGKDEYFVLGDNRNNSRDSRYADVGNVHKDEIIGKVIIRLSPIKKFGFIK